MEVPYNYVFSIISLKTVEYFYSRMDLGASFMHSMIWYLEWRKSRSLSNDFNSGLKTVEATILLPRRLPQSQTGSLDGLNTKPKCSPNDEAAWESRSPR
jgi:hypothetical protein